VAGVTADTSGRVQSIDMTKVSADRPCTTALETIALAVRRDTRWFPELNRAALEALSKWTFTPGTLNGVPVDVLFNYTINFKH
jgi:Gram-negative bacterial TonB protein C-terminal